jgi:alpha-tubulin suppressor-like RCC1 family protein
MAGLVYGGTPQTITFAPIPVKKTADASFSLSGTASSGLPVTYQIVGGSSVASVSGNTVTLTSTPGAYTVAATQAGDGTYDPAPAVLQSSSVMGGAPYVKVFSGSAAGGPHVLGIRSDGTLWSWGYTNYGQLGDGTNLKHPGAIQVGTATNWKSAALGHYFTLAIKTDGTLWAWGQNTSGQLGQGAGDGSYHPTPLQVGTDTNWKEIAAGQDHALAVKTDGTLWSWGSNSNGQLGLGTSDSTAHGTPTQVDSSTDWQSMTAGLYHTLAVKTTGTLWTCGVNTNGQLGDGTTTQHTSLAQVGSATNWQNVAAGQTQSFAIRTDGTLWAWGYNILGMLGDGSSSQRTSPVQTGTATNWKSVSSGQYHTVAMKTDGTLWAWGNNPAGQLGDGTFTRKNSPVPIGEDADWLTAGVTIDGAFGLKTDGSYFVWGGGPPSHNELGFIPRCPLPSVASANMLSTVAAGAQHTVAIKADGTLWAWGYNSNGQLGDGTQTGRPNPVQVGTANNWKSVAPGSYHTLGVKTDGSLWGWGANFSGQIGDGSTSSRFSPTRIGLGTNWKTAAAGSGHTLAIKTDGTLWAWGDNTYGQLGDTTTTQRTSPVQIGTATDWSSVSCGIYHTLALKADGTLWAWGQNAYGQLGNSNPTQRTSPVQVGSATNWKSVAAGAYFTSAMKTNGTVWAWGSNHSGQLGMGTNDSSFHSTPAQVGTVIDWKSIATGGYFTLALKNDGTLWAWGDNSWGQLGDGTTTALQSSPTQIGTSTAWSALPTLSQSGHAMAFTSDGTLWGFGSNGNGQLASAGRNQTLPIYVEPGLTTQSLIFGTLPGLIVGNTIALNATATSGLPASYIISGPATLSGNQLTVTGAGPVTVIAYQPGDSFWQATDISAQTVTAVAPAAPGATTLAATLITGTGATFNGTIDANNASTTVTFEYGTTMSYGSNMAAINSPVTGDVSTGVSAATTGLVPGTTYHFRVSGTNSVGSNNGSDVTFTTLSRTQSWRQTWFQTPNNSGDAADAADPDYDGMLNLIEFGCHLDPTKSSPQPGVAVLVGNTIEFTHTRSKAAIADGVTYSVEWSDTLATGSWTNGGVTESLLSEDGNVQTIKATLPAGSSGRRFVHLKVTAP